MLFERISYPDDFPIHITIAEIDDYPIHYHQDIEFVCVLKGEVKLKNGYCHYVLKEGDTFTNSGHEVHSLASTGEENVVALIQISTRFFSQYFPDLSKSCYRTYSNKAHTPRHDNLREKLLQILLRYCTKSFSYKTECTYLMVDTIRYLEKYFNLFAFEGDMVVNFEDGNPVATERISRIISYIYQHYTEKITLQDLSDMEHLSTFYLSHIIKSCTGMNFREFLCFARVEWSEIDLLDTNKKISRIAHDVGFSTTAYYEKYFKKWFRETPQEHRARCQPLVKSDLHPEVIRETPPNSAIRLIRDTLSSFDAQKSSTSVINSLKLEVNLDAEAEILRHIDPELEIQVTCADLRALNCHLTGRLQDLHPDMVTILASDIDKSAEIEQLKQTLSRAGFVVRVQNQMLPRPTFSYANDSLALPIDLFSRRIHGEESHLTLRLRDYGDMDSTLKGMPALLTSRGIRKPSFYGYQLLSLARGELIAWGKQYCVIRRPSTAGEVPSFVMIAYNENDAMQSMCVNETTAHQAKQILNDFNDEIDLNVSLTLEPGMYSIVRYSMGREKNLFSYAAALDFREEMSLANHFPELIYTEPDIDICMEDVRTMINIRFAMKGPGLQVAVIRPKGGNL